MGLSFENSGAGSFSPNMGIEYLYNHYYSRLCYYAFKIIDNQNASKDIVQDAFVKFWDNRQNFENETTVKNYLYVTVRNACFNYVRHEGVEKRYAENIDQEEYAEEIGLDQIIRAEVMGEIQKAIEALPDGCRSVIKLAFIEGLANDEIAKHLGISVNTVKSQKQRALQLLRLKLDFKAFLVLMTLLHP